MLLQTPDSVAVRMDSGNLLKMEPTVLPPGNSRWVSGKHNMSQSVFADTPARLAGLSAFAALVILGLPGPATRAANTPSIDCLEIAQTSPSASGHSTKSPGGDKRGIPVHQGTFHLKAHVAPGSSKRMEPPAAVVRAQDQESVKNLAPPDEILSQVPDRSGSPSSAAPRQDGIRMDYTCPGNSTQRK